MGIQPSDKNLNQCDGCQINAPLENGLHFYNGKPYMACTAHKYCTKLEPKTTEASNEPRDNRLVSQDAASPTYTTNG